MACTRASALPVRRFIIARSATDSIPKLDAYLSPPPSSSRIQRYLVVFTSYVRCAYFGFQPHFFRRFLRPRGGASGYGSLDGPSRPSRLCSVGRSVSPGQLQCSMPSTLTQLDRLVSLGAVLFALSKTLGADFYAAALFLIGLGGCGVHM